MSALFWPQKSVGCVDSESRLIQLWIWGFPVGDTGKAWFSEPLNSEHSRFSVLSPADQNFT